MPIQEIQRDFAVKDDLTPYRGSWVALRAGKVVANALDPVELRNNPGVQDDDWFLLVPSNINGTFFL